MKFLDSAPSGAEGMAESADIKDVPHLQTGALSLANLPKVLPSEGRLCSMKWSILHRTFFWKASGPEREPLRQSERRLLSGIFLLFLSFFNLLLLTLPVCVSLSPLELSFQYWSFVESALASPPVTGGRAEPPPSNEGPSRPHCPRF